MAFVVELDDTDGGGGKHSGGGGLDGIEHRGLFLIDPKASCSRSQ